MSSLPTKMCAVTALCCHHCRQHLPTASWSGRSQELLPQLISNRCQHHLHPNCSCMHLQLAKSRAEISGLEILLLIMDPYLRQSVWSWWKGGWMKIEADHGLATARQDKHLPHHEMKCIVGCQLSMQDCWRTSKCNLQGEWINVCKRICTPGGMPGVGWWGESLVAGKSDSTQVSLETEVLVSHQSLPSSHTTTTNCLVYQIY